MSVRDLRFYNEDTKQWENLLASNVDLLKVDTKVENHVKDLIPHLQPGERELIVNSFQTKSERLSNVDFNTVLNKGVYAMGVGLINCPSSFYGNLIVYVSDDVVTQVYYDLDGGEFIRGSKKNTNGDREWETWNRNVTGDDLIVTNDNIGRIYNRYKPDGAMQLVDWDTLVETGTYQGDQYALNSPPLLDWYVGEYIAHNIYYGVLNVNSLHNPHVKYRRRKNNNVWGPWVMDRSGIQEWIPVPMVNGFGGWIYCTAYGNNLVSVKYRLDIVPTIEPSTLIGTIPYNLRPDVYTPLLGWSTNGAPYKSEVYVNVYDNGEIRLPYASSIIAGSQIGIIGGGIYYASQI